MKFSDVVAVIPSIRQINMEYLEPLGNTKIIVVDDTDGTIKSPNKNVHVTDYAEYEKYLGKKEYLIPRKNPSCKNFGIWLAHKWGADIIILLDDDVDLRVTPDYLAKIPINGKAVTAYAYDDGSPWVNSMAALTKVTGLYARGFPYEYRGIPMKVPTTHSVKSMFNEGLWSGTADINGIDKLNGAEATNDKRIITTRLYAKREQQIPLSIMNVQFHSSLAPAFYQPPDYVTNSGFKVRRHDDVWSMMFLKAIMDAYGDYATIGEPMVKHCKEGDMYKEILAEHVTNLIQPHLYHAITVAKENLMIDGYKGMAESLGLRLYKNTEPGEWREIIANYGLYCAEWAGLF